MDFRELSYVLAIARHGSITKAAQALYISQPTLSKFLIGLEQDLGLKLFDRVGQRYRLTYAGERYVKKAEQILHLKEDLDGELADILRRDVGVLNVAFAPMRCACLLPYVLPLFAQQRPHVKVNVFEGSSAENDRRLLEGQVDIAFYSMPQSPDAKLEYRTLWAEEMLLCTPQGHPAGRFAQKLPDGRRWLDPARVQAERVLMMLPEQRTRQIVDGYLQQRGLHFDNVVYTSNMTAIMELVAAGYGVSFLFESHLRHHTLSRPIDCYSFGAPAITADFVAATRRGGYVSLYAQEFIAAVGSYFARG